MMRTGGASVNLLAHFFTILMIETMIFLETKTKKTTFFYEKHTYEIPGIPGPYSRESISREKTIFPGFPHPGISRVKP